MSHGVDPCVSEGGPRGRTATAENVAANRSKDGATRTGNRGCARSAIYKVQALGPACVPAARPPTRANPEIKGLQQSALRLSQKKWGVNGAAGANAPGGGAATRPARITVPRRKLTAR